jgi:hypothetical protein
MQTIEAEVLELLSRGLQAPYGEWVWCETRCEFSRGNFTLGLRTDATGYHTLLSVKIDKWDEHGSKLCGGSMQFPRGLSAQEYVSRIYAAIWFITGAFPET